MAAIHDIMKVNALLPCVESAHAPYAGFAAGSQIHDHDVALSYLLDHHPGVLPSYRGLDEPQRRTLYFCTCKIAFNHGWLVQAEAPPAPLFARFKQTISLGEAASADVAFYFVHWLTDLAGAVPTPLDGSEKLLGFPSSVLRAFVRSFGVLQELAFESETEVSERFLEQSWAESSEAAGLGALPTGEGAIALMRLVTHSQSSEEQHAVATAFPHLAPADLVVLAHEMSLTGLPQQHYRRSPARVEGGPAILVYYAPAFLRHHLPHDASDGLALLAELYRRARMLWPLVDWTTAAAAAPHQAESVRAEYPYGHSVTVRIDRLRGLSIAEVRSVYANGRTWVLTKMNEQEAVVQCHTLAAVAEMLAVRTPCVLLTLWDPQAVGSTPSPPNGPAAVDHIVVGGESPAMSYGVRAGASLSTPVPTGALPASPRAAFDEFTAKGLAASPPGAMSRMATQYASGPHSLAMSPRAAALEGLRSDALAPSGLHLQARLMEQRRNLRDQRRVENPAAPAEAPLQGGDAWGHFAWSWSSPLAKLEA